MRNTVANLSRKDFIEKYADAKVVFTSYYKYTFTFEGQVDDKTITIYVGGHAENIYRFDVGANQEYTIRDLHYWLDSGTVGKGDLILEEYSEK